MALKQLAELSCQKLLLPVMKRSLARSAMNSNKAVFGVHMGRLKDDRVFRRHLESLTEMMLKGQIDPVIDSVWRFEQVADAQRHMHDRKNRGKVLLDFSDG